MFKKRSRDDRNRQKTAKEAPWHKQKRRNDKVLTDGKPDDIIIPVMGATGAGKSTLINKLAGNLVMEVSHKFESCTKQLAYCIIDFPDTPFASRYPELLGRRLILVDTPGFEDTFLDDAEILRRISVWLATSYAENVTVSGIIYLFDMSQTRITHSGRQNLELFEDLCGKKALARVILSEVKWEMLLQQEEGEEILRERETDLASSFWKEMIGRDAKVFRLENTSGGAWEVVEIICSKIAEEPHDIPSSDAALQIEGELVDLNRTIPATAVGKRLRERLREALHSRQRAFQETIDPAGRATLREEMAIIFHQINRDLRIPISQRIRAFFGLPMR